MRYTLAGALVIDGRERRPECQIVVDGDGGWIEAVGPEVTPVGAVVDAHDALVVPGFIDVHTHGGGGFALHTESPEEIVAYARWAPSTGTTAFLINVIGVPGGLPEPQLLAAVDAIERCSEGAEPVGIHLEGPYINPARRGAHHLSWLRRPDPAEMERMLELSRGWLRLATLAPELPGADLLIRQLVDAGVTVSIGHTDATYEQARRAIALGIRHATHCFNAMPPLLHRAPGPLGAIVEADEVTGELVGDCIHVLPPAMRVLIRALGPNRTVVVTDAQPAAGLPEGATFSFGGLTARVAGGVARLSDGTIAGSVVTMDQALRNLVQQVGVALEDAVAMLTANPARVAGVAARKGRLRAGCDADLVILDQGLRVQATICRGHVAFATGEWCERLAGLTPDGEASAG
jgi:N-acetylglucosamine-6-phosphate deacetylase